MGSYLIEVELDFAGRPQQTNNKHKILEGETLFSVAWWGSGIKGVAVFTFPHPEGWRLGEAQEPLNKLSARTITGLFRSQQEEQPTCVASWDKILGPINWDVIRSLYSSPGLTPRDWASHFKLVIRRAFFVRRINSDAPNPRCRCCGRELESLAHFASCSVIGKAKYGGSSICCIATPTRKTKPTDSLLWRTVGCYPEGRRTSTS